MLRVAYAAAHGGTGSAPDSRADDSPLTAPHGLADDGPSSSAYATTQNGGCLICMGWGAGCAQCEQATA